MLCNGEKISYEVQEGALLIHVRGEIDHHSAAPLREEIDFEMEKYRPRVLALDMAEVSFMDSSGLGLVLGRVSRGEELGCRVEILHADERIQRILKMAGAAHIRNIKIL
jgi:stage II sporulation protein AA (anti-sigma F factor antagonist)